MIADNRGGRVDRLLQVSLRSVAVNADAGPERVAVALAFKHSLLVKVVGGLVVSEDESSTEALEGGGPGNAVEANGAADDSVLKQANRG